MYEYDVTIRRIVDGDTIDVYAPPGFGVDDLSTMPSLDEINGGIDLGFGIIVAGGRIFLKERMRLAGIDTPESRTRDRREKRFGKLATARVKELLPVGGTFRVASKSFDSKGKFGRAMVDFVLPDRSQTLCDLLLEERMAVPYHGQHKSEIRALHEANWAALEAQGR